MSTEHSQRWALYGGAGFIGQHLALSILQRFPQDCVHLLDLQAPGAISWKAPLQQYLGTPRLELHQCDVRDLASLRQHAAPFRVMVNLAAIHREPGHRAAEYFATNVAGAENICTLADEVNCRELLFTSSISVYGLHDQGVDEDTTPQPRTPYGQSKLQAEQVQRDWAQRSGGRLAIIRPGVVFGSGEDGNVTRLVREMLKRQRPIRIHPDQVKAGIYIQELVDVVHWLRQQALAAKEVQLINGVSHESLSFNAYGRTLGRIRELPNAPLVVPGRALDWATALMSPLAGLFPSGARFHPQRLRKLLRANDIRPTALNRMGYPFHWPLQRALADWLEKGL